MSHHDDQPLDQAEFNKTDEESNTNQQPQIEEDLPPKKLSFAKKEYALRRVLDGEMDEIPWGEGIPRFPSNFRVYATKGGKYKRAIIEILKDEGSGNWTANLVEELSYMSGIFMNSCIYPIKYPSSIYEVSSEQAEKIINIWKRDTKKILKEFPKPLGLKSDPKLVFNRLSFYEKEINKTQLVQHAPVFNEILSRMTNAPAFCQRLGSLYDHDADRVQSVWLWGPEDGGKSLLTPLLKMMTAGSVGLLPTDEEGDKNWKANLVGVRAAVGNEAAVNFINTSKFKSLTGDDDHDITQKYEKTIRAKLDCMIFFETNDKPRIPNHGPLKKRLIVCNLRAVALDKRRDKHLVLEDLKNELPYIVGYCLWLYKSMGQKRITCEMDELNEAIEEFESYEAGICDKYFEVAAGGKLLNEDLRDILFKENIRSNADYSKFKDFLCRYFKVEEAKEKGGRRFIENLQKIPPSEPDFQSSQNVRPFRKKHSWE